MQAISTPNAPAAIGPYSQAIRIGSMVYAAGQIALDATSGKLVGDDASSQTEKVLENLGEILHVAGSSLYHLVKTTVYLQDLTDFPAVNEVYARHVGSPPPARSTVEVSKLPLGALVEIEAVAIVP
ncbi:MAG: reactive intermediate/imine deaminase [Gemmatimonadetes bacterium]|nr:reactive intermediate/imine deaminase [Gemmatimonadota bacterium]